jgi:hypothetical protein
MPFSGKTGELSGIQTRTRECFLSSESGRKMRDPERIPKIAAKLARLWSRHPDLRLGQLVTIVTNDLPGHPNRNWPDPFYVEDDELEERLDLALEHGINYWCSTPVETKP